MQLITALGVLLSSADLVAMNSYGFDVSAGFFYRLNGSSSPVLTATPRSYGKGQNSPPTKSKPLNGLE